MKTRLLLLALVLTSISHLSSVGQPRQASPPAAQKAKPAPPGTADHPVIATQAGRNVLLIVADDLGIDRSRQYMRVTGNQLADLPATPTIQKLARSGVTFDNAWANPMCSPTRAAFLTGRHSFRTTVTYASSKLPASETTLPQIVDDAGYASGLFGKWHLGGGDNGPRERGFDTHVGIVGGTVGDYESWEKHVNGSVFDGDRSTPDPDPVTKYTTRVIAKDARHWIGRQTGPWLAVVAFNAPHTPIHRPTADCDGVQTDDPVDNGIAYNRMVECMDDRIDWLLSELAKDGKLENTTIIFLGDNGTDGKVVLPPFGDASPRDSKKTYVYEGGIRVPFIIADGYHYQHGTAAPATGGTGRVVAPGRREDGLVHAVDVFATVAAIAGVTSAAEDSVSMIPYLRSATAADQRQTMYTDSCQGDKKFQAAIRDDTYKLVYQLDYESEVPELTVEFFAVSDLSESNLVIGQIGTLSLLAEMKLLWDSEGSEGYDPLEGCAMEG